MTTLVLTLVGDDRAGLVSAVADIVDAHGGNWENSELAELAGAFAGIVEISIAADRAGDLRAALEGLAGTLTVTVHAGWAAAPVPSARSVTFDVVGNDRAGIVREVSSALSTRGASIERMSTLTTDAAMAGGRLFEATITATEPADVAIDDLVAGLERLASEIRVDVSLADQA
ncbi:glycine cleavage system protein R [Microbacterium sp. NPDC090007]|uniref:glycine cleavage system protein R n=1 Tax=Microbacterium sp. NPDC090007 TaxID=3364204 RepID=UPI003807575B